MAKFNRLSNGNIEAIALVRKGANRKRIFLKKEHADEGDLIDFGPTTDLIVKADWSRFYCVVAEPGSPEDPGVLAKDQSIPDIWDEDEIAKAQLSFVKNGGLINKMHESLDPYGTLVENAIALADFYVDGELIKKGSWYIAVEPTAEGKAAIEKGEFTGVSIQGTATRTLVEKAEQFTKPGIANVSASDRKKLGPLLAHYAAQAHPFGSCKRDQMKHGLSEDHANRRCAVLKQLIGVRKLKVAKGMGEGDAPWSEDVGLALDRIDVQAQMLKCEVSAFLPLLEDEIAKARPFNEQKHPRKGGKFAPKGTATVAARGGGKPANTAAGTSPAEQQRANRLHTASNILSSLGYKGQKLGDAIRDFQKKNGLPETGEVDARTMVTLRAKMGGRRKKQQAKRKGNPPMSAPKRVAARARQRVAKRGFLERLHPRKNDGKFRDKGPATAIEALSGGVLKPKTTDQQQMTADLINLKDGETKDFGHGVKATKKGKHIHITGAGDKAPIKMPAFELKDHLYAKDAVLRRLEAAKKARSKVKKAKLSAAERKRLPDSAFAGPNRTCPIHDLNHAKAALSMCADVPGVKEKVYRKFPQLKPDRMKKAESPVWVGIANG